MPEITDLEGFEFAFWVAFVSIMGTLFGIVFTIYKYLNSQKENRKLEFVNQIEHYEKEFLKIRDNYTNSDHMYEKCRISAASFLMTIERLSYLRNQNLINQDTIQYFQHWFNICDPYFDWLETMYARKLDGAYPNFMIVRKSVNHTQPRYTLDSLDGNFNLHLKRKKSKPEYDPTKKPHVTNENNGKI